MRNAVLTIHNGSGSREVRLADYLDADAEERALADAHTWIKGLRHLEVEGRPLRRRFTIRGDSLWWFAELYLHKQQVILSIFRTIAALDRLAAREQPRSIHFVSGGRTTRVVAPAFANARGIRYSGPPAPSAGILRIARMDARARALAVAAFASRLRPRATGPSGQPEIAAFVHRAFWRTSSAAGDAESYIGPVLTALEQRLKRSAIRYVGVGPAANFGARRWWHALRSEGRAGAVIPVESFAPLSALEASRRIWRGRHAHRRALWNSDAVRRHAVIDGCDCWSLVREELAGIALLQWPWSVRAMDEAGAALDALRPAVALTYAEAGGWGRALILEGRRRGIPLAGLQHGFIYRHWLNYLHEPDEMLPDPENPKDAGFPRPTLTLLFDRYAAAHLEQAGRFPPASLAVTGSPRLDALVQAASTLDGDAVAAARASAGAGPGQALVLVVTKYREARHVLPALVDAVANRPDIQLAIKTHPAETPDAYDAIAAGRSNVRVLPASAPLAPLLRACRAVVTVNSTVALDAAVLGVPSLVIGLPSNLSPFVDAGALAGAGSDAATGPALNRILYDEEFRLQLDRERRAFLTQFAMGADGRAARRAADAVLALAVRPADRQKEPES